MQPLRAGCIPVSIRLLAFGFSSPFSFEGHHLPLLTVVQYLGFVFVKREGEWEHTTAQDELSLCIPEGSDFQMEWACSESSGISTVADTGAHDLACVVRRELSVRDSPTRKRLRVKTPSGDTSYPPPHHAEAACPVATVQPSRVERHPEHLQADDTVVFASLGHNLLRSGSVLWCCRCGSFITGHRLSKCALTSRCPGPPLRGGSRADRLNRLRQNRHPHTRERLPAPVRLSAG